MGFVILAEIKIPDSGMGEDKKKLVIAKLTGLFKGHADISEKAVGFIDDAAKALDGDMKDFISLHDSDEDLSQAPTDPR